MHSFHSVRGLRIRLASPDMIRSWSSGEVVRPDTLNYRTLKPEFDGLFCERIFGPIKSYTCACEKYRKNRKYNGQRCDVCGVLIAPARIRRFSMGHIELASPVAHPWFTHGNSNRMSLLLDLTPRELNDVLYFQRYIVLAVDEEARSREVQRVEEEIERLQSLSDVPILLVRSDMGGTSPSSLTVSVASAAVKERVNKTETILADSEVPQDELILQEIDKLPEGSDSIHVREEVGIEIAQVAEMMPRNTAPHWRSQRLQELRRLGQDLLALREGSLLTVERYRFLHMEAGDVFQADIGASALRVLLAQLDLGVLAQTIRQEITEKIGSHRIRAIKRLKLVEALRSSGVRPEWMVMTVLPVLPPDLRPLIRTKGGNFASADVNELYSRVIHRNNRLKHFLAMDTPDLIINREKLSLQLACDALFDNGHTRRPFVGLQKRPLRSLSDTLSGKGGRFRHNLLGKRVDYSGRSVISVGLDLKLHQCGLPKKIALELFKPFIIHNLIASGLFETHRQARRAVERTDPAVWDALEEVMRGKVVLLNRAPTLHRLSIQAFEPVLVEGSAIRLHPQVCSAFNADFDGDQMAVHLPLTREAQAEARERLFSIHNLLSPASGEPSISVAQEQVLGCYYLTQEQPQKKGAERQFADEQDAIQAYEHGLIDLQAPIYIRTTRETIYEQPPPVEPVHLARGSRLRTTVGRLIFNQAVPKILHFHNYAMKKDFLRQLVWECIKQCGQERAAVMANTLKRLGFHHSTKAALSFSMKDVVVPPQKKEILAQADEKIAELRKEWQEGMMTREELYQRSIDLWKEATDAVAQHVQSVLDPYGSIATIASSGATKAKLQQIRQLSGMRGLMASPSGAIIETPVRGNFLEGLTVAEYFLSSHGARKSLMDRSLNTAQSGYLTIQLINVAQDVIVTEEDCGTQESVVISDEESASLGLSDSSSRLIGRVLGEDVPQAGLREGQELDEKAVALLLKAGVTEVGVRSVLVCQARYGVCRKCYGWDLSKRAIVQKGTAVGIIAAQSIGEPGTQLTMRTFHSGGIAGGQGDITQGIPRVKELFGAHIPKDSALVSEMRGVVSVMKDERTNGYRIQVVSDRRALIEKEEAIRTYTIPPGRRVLVQSGQRVRAGDPLTNGARNLQELLHYQGRVALERYLLQEIQLVYRTTGAYIHEKHFETIIRQMVRYVRVEKAGDTKFLPGDTIDRFAYNEANERIRAEGGTPATAYPIVLGLIPATLATESWLAAASFQQTTQILTDAMLEGRIDHLRGLKENVILGKMIPAGSGVLPRLEQPVRRKRGRPPKHKKGIVLF